jgi:O-antigen ligase
MTYTTATRDGFMLLIKYIIPVLFLWLGYSGLRNEEDLIIFLKVANITACVYCLFIGGQGCKLMPWLYYGPIGGQFLTYAGFADFLTSIFIVPIMLYWLTKEKKYIFCALWMVLSTVLESVRTGMGGMMLVFVVAMLLKNKAKALPGLLFAGGLFLGIVLFVPSVNEKFFGEDAGTVSATDIVQGDAMSMDNINTSGRTSMWEMILDECYKGNETFGSGLGVSMRFLKDWAAFTGAAPIMHNDYVQILSDTGIVGIVLLCLFYAVFLLKGIIYVVLRKSSTCVKITGIMAVSSMAGIAFSMYYDNEVSHSMSSLVMPFIFLGFFLKSIDLDENKQLSK